VILDQNILRQNCRSQILGSRKYSVERHDFKVSRYGESGQGSIRPDIRKVHLPHPESQHCSRLSDERFRASRKAQSETGLAIDSIKSESWTQWDRSHSQKPLPAALPSRQAQPPRFVRVLKCTCSSHTLNLPEHQEVIVCEGVSE